MRDISDPYSGHTQNVAIRDSDHGFWTHCFEQLERNDELDRICVVGTPGIGKSTTVLAFAIRKLLLQKKKEVYQKRSAMGIRDYIELFAAITTTTTTGAPNMNPIVEYKYNVIPGETPINKIPFLRDCETYLIVDPGDTKDSCDPPGEVKAKVIILASPDENHWGGNAFEKRDETKDGGFFLYFPPWSIAELIAGASQIGQLLPAKLTQDCITLAFSVFGGVPRQTGL